MNNNTSHASEAAPNKSIVEDCYTGKVYTIPNGWYRLRRGTKIRGSDLILMSGGFEKALIPDDIINHAICIRRRVIKK